MAVTALLHKSVDGRISPDLSYGLSDDVGAERGVAVSNDSTGLDFGNLPIEGARHEALPQRFHTASAARQSRLAAMSGDR